MSSISQCHSIVCCSAVSCSLLLSLGLMSQCSASPPPGMFVECPALHEDKSVWREPGTPAGGVLSHKVPEELPQLNTPSSPPPSAVPACSVLPCLDTCPHLAHKDGCSSGNVSQVGWRRQRHARPCFSDAWREREAVMGYRNC
ncbi:hypothetical protein E2C01_029143 [Portunus trituberculatus]|uniref:Uncharacterized protein n=1 Tax=Portunus trituberculatus TaxID=210409 RepID=A0A5B7END9_PORTR|nr:hypothetical protein [Portunus trituberculatus]